MGTDTSVKPPGVRNWIDDWLERFDTKTSRPSELPGRTARFGTLDGRCSMCDGNGICPVCHRQGLIDS
jgi:hypothetical protein